jgi:glycosyltransferase involved in cell wall biosynthesis
LFRAGDPDDAAQLLARLAEDTALRGEIGRRLRARQQRLFSLETHVSKLERIYRDVVART